MRLSIARYPTIHENTFGRLSMDGRFYCYTLEDAVREIAGQPVASWKIPGKTAIPAGSYRVTIDWSNHFKRLMPHVLGVDGFTGVRIHPGNIVADTDGCPLVGMHIGDGRLLDSEMAFVPLIQAILAQLIAGQPVDLDIASDVTLDRV